LDLSFKPFIGSQEEWQTTNFPIDFQKLNVIIKKCYFPLPFNDNNFNAIDGHECYSFLDRLFLDITKF
jgi:hypothetical protein